MTEDVLEILDRMIDEDSRRRRGGMDALRARIAELEAALSKSIMHQKELDRCVHLTEEQIDAAWERLHEIGHRMVEDGYRQALRDIGIVACEKCGGSGEVQTPETYAIETDGWDEACRDCKGHGWIWSIDGGGDE